MALWLIPLFNDEKGGLYNERQENLIEWLGFGFSIAGTILPPLPSPLYMMMKSLAVSQGRTISAMMIAEDYLDGEYEFSVMLDKMSGVAEDAIDDTGIIETPDLFSVVEGFGYEGAFRSGHRYDTRCVFTGNTNRRCRLNQGHGGRHEF